MILTTKQRDIMAAIMAGNRGPDGHRESWLDIDQLLERVPYRTTKASMQFSIRALIDKGMLTKGEIEQRRGRKRRVLVPTNLAFDTFSSAPPPKITESDDGIVEYC